MPVSISDVQFRLSGGSANTNPNNSLGGQISTTQINPTNPQNLFDNISSAEASAGDIEYRCFYVFNSNATDTFFEVTVYISSQTTSTSTSIEIGADPSGPGNGSTTGVATTIANEGVAPAGVVFSSPSTPVGGIILGDFGPQQGRAVWVRRTVLSGALFLASDETTLAVRGAI